MGLGRVSHYRQQMTTTGQSPTLSPAEFARLMESLPGMVGFWDSGGRLSYANSAYADFFARPLQDVVGATFAEVLGPELYQQQRPLIERALAGEEHTVERRLELQDGRTRHVRASYVPHVEGGELRGVFLLVDDITDKVLADQAAQASARQSALLEERQRIAADLHDLVIQRLFAAGLDLSAVQRGASDTESRIAQAAVGIDEAIRELRRAIYSLREASTSSALPDTVAHILDMAGRTLGFPPEAHVVGSLDQVPDEAVKDLLAVLSESLSNVARHADASQAVVNLTCTADAVQLTVADDGRGIAEPSQLSGLTNMRRRAERHGGSFHCRDNEPRGTVVEWTVPVASEATA